MPKEVLCLHCQTLRNQVQAIQLWLEGVVLLLELPADWGEAGGYHTSRLS